MAKKYKKIAASRKIRVVHRRHKSRLKINLLISLLILIIISSVIIYFYQRDAVVAKVNGEKITAKRIDALYNSLPNGSGMNKNIIMWRLIDTKILVNYIEDQGYGLTEEEFNKLLNEELKKEGVTLSELKKELKLRGSSIDEIKENFMIIRFVNNAVIPQVNVTDEHVAAYKKMIGSGGLTDEQIRNKLKIQFRSDIIKELTSNYTEKVDLWVNEEYRELYRQQ